MPNKTKITETTIMILKFDFTEFNSFSLLFNFDSFRNEKSISYIIQVYSKGKSTSQIGHRPLSPL